MSGIRLSSARPRSCSPPFSAFEGTDGDGDVNIYRACVGNDAGLASKITNLNDGGVTSDGMHNPVMSPNGTKILFELANTSTGYTEIWVVSRTPGSTPTQLVADASNYCLHPSWGADNDTFVYVKGAGGALTGGSILKDTVSSPGSPTTLKTASGGFSPYRPAFNFDGTRVAYLWDQDVGGTGHLRVMDADGTNDASLDTAVKYRFQGPQFSWAHASNVLAYDDGDTSGAGNTYVINADGTGQVQINANGVAAGLTCRVSDRAWPPDDSYVVFSANLALGVGHNPIRAELDGSNTTDLDASHGAYAQDYFRHVLVADNRIWFIQSNVVLGSVALDGTDYRADLTIDGAAMGSFANGDGWFYN